MQRRLEDVSHFFLDHRTSVQPVSVTPARAEPRARVVYVAGLGDDVSAAVITAGLAACAATSGRRVLLAQVDEQPFDVAIALGATRASDQSALMEAATDLWVSPRPLLGAKRPGVLFDQRLAGQWEAGAAQADVVLIHANNRHPISRVPGMPTPDEFLVMEGDGGRDAAIQVYRTIKRMVSWNSAVELGLIAVGGNDLRPGSSLERVAQAVGAFLARDCRVVGRVGDAAALSRAVLSGVVRCEARDEVSPWLKPIADRWDRFAAPGRPPMLAGACREDARITGRQRGRDLLRHGPEPCP